MSENIAASSSWKYLSSAGSRLSSLRTYVSTSRPGSPRLVIGDERQSWRAWAGQKFRERRGGAGRLDSSVDAGIVDMFPSWAARRYVKDASSQVPSPFEVEVFVAGFASVRRTPENATRSQRAFLRLAKSFASLPKIVDSPTDVVASVSSLAHLAPQMQGRLTVQPLSHRDITNDDLDVEILERELNRVKQNESDEDPESCSESSSPLYSPAEERPAFNGFETPPEGQPPPHDIQHSTAMVLKRLHDNLEKRIHLLWYSALPNRTIRLHVFAVPNVDDGHRSKDQQNSSDSAGLYIDQEHGPLASQDVTTAADGSFQVKFRVKWEDMCSHPRALHIAFGETLVEHDLLVVAQLLPPSVSHSPLSSPSRTPPPTPLAPTPSLASIIRVPITHSPIRVISDIDDTVKNTGLLSGTRTAFYNVFVRELRENVIPGIGEWYMKMFSRGIRFHYVSNGPFAILPILKEFFHISQLPPGSLKLRSYGGRSLFEGLLTAPATRKRGNVLEVLDSFPDSKFILIGDTGEQDLELYAEVARDRPNQILAAFLRDADTDCLKETEPLRDPTGWNVIDAAGTCPSRPSVSRNSSTASSSGSFASLWNKFPSYKATDTSGRSSSLPLAGSADTVNRSEGESSTQTSFEIDTVPVSNQAESVSSNNVGMKIKDQGSYFGLGPLTSHPETDESLHQDVTVTPTLNLSELTTVPSTSPPISRSTSQPSSSSVPCTPNRILITEPPKPIQPPSITNPHRSSSATSSSNSLQIPSSPSCENGSANGKKTTLMSVTKRRNELQTRVYRARTQMPSHVVLRVFRDPVECVELEEILSRGG